MKYLIKYLIYILEHKKNVFIECWKIGLYWHAITHDLSKFLPSEFFPYAKKFFGGDYAYKYFEVEDNFSKAWKLHYSRNKHHWNYWIEYRQNGDAMYCPEIAQFALPMPEKYVLQMIADWKGMSRKFGDTAVEFYAKNLSKMILHSETKKIINKKLKTAEEGK